MVRSEIDAPGFRVTLWETAALPLSVSQDASLVILRGGTLRAAVVDGRTPGETAAIVQAGDCVAWALEAGEWRRLFPEGAMTGEAAERDRQWYRENAGLDLPDLLRQERARDYVNDESAWRTAAVGRFATPKLARMDLRGWEMLLLATDGARLRPERIDRLEAWLDGLREWELASPHEESILTRKPHDDVKRPADRARPMDGHFSSAPEVVPGVA